MIKNINIVNNEIAEIQHKITYFSLNNILYSCIFSGFGYEELFTEKVVKGIEKELSKDNFSKEVLSNYIPLNLIYRKANPNLEISSTFPKYRWDYKSFDKTLSIEIQALAILALCKACEHSISKTEELVMMHTAINLYNFTTSFLRSETGEFLSAYNKASDPTKELKLKYETKKVNIYHHILMLEATLALSKAVKSASVKSFTSEKYLDFDKDFLYLWEYILGSQDILSLLKTDELSLSILSLTRCLNCLMDETVIASLTKLILYLSLELASRVKITGEVQKSNFNEKSISVLSHVRASLALMEVSQKLNTAYLTNSSDDIDTWLDDLYNEQLFMFSNNEDGGIDYQMNDISDVCLYFLNLLKKDQSDYNLNRFINFYNNALENTSMVQSIANQSICIDDISIALSSKLPLLEISKKAPVFSKNLIITTGKSPTVKVSKHYNSANGLYASYLFLYYFT